MNSWLNEIVQQHSEFESPVSFWRWSAIAAISAVVKDNIWLDKFLYKLYPNVYIMLHADSGLKKGAPIAMAKKLVRACNSTRIISGRSSIQGILKKLSIAETKPGGEILKGSRAFICSSELSSSIVEDKAATVILTDLYDRNYNEGDWESLLKAETFNLKDATVTMLTATNEAHSDDFFAKKDIQGGYFARTFIVYESEASKVNSLMYKPSQTVDYDKSAEYLKELSKLKGPLEMDQECRKFFDDWYKDFKGNIHHQKIKDPTGTLNRFDDSVLKVAILISLGTRPELNISLDAIKEAVAICEKLIGNVRRTTLSRGKSQWAPEKALIIQELIDRDNHAITRQMLNKKYWMRANADEWDSIMVSLETAGIVRREHVGNNVIWEMPEDQVRDWKKQMAGK